MGTQNLERIVLLDASALREWAHTCVSDLITHVLTIGSASNVFPVADSDTGANMLFTMRSALAEGQCAGTNVGANVVGLHQWGQRGGQRCGPAGRAAGRGAARGRGRPVRPVR